MQNWLENWTNAKFCDVVNLILGAFLFVSPWIFGFDAGTVSPNAYITGIAIAILAIAALAAFAVWEEWLNLIVGLWAFVSPWVLGFQGTTAMTVRRPGWSSSSASPGADPGRGLRIDTGVEPGGASSRRTTTRCWRR